MTPRDIVLTLFVVFCWGFGFTLAKPAVEQFPAIFLMTICFAFTAALLLVVQRRPAKTSHLRAAVIALFAVTLQAALIFKGLEGLQASTAVLIAQTQVPMAVMWAWALGVERFDWRKLLALAVAFAGIVVIAGLPESKPAALPLTLLLAGNVAWGLGQTLIGWIGEDEGPVLLRRVALHGTAQLALATLLFEQGQIAAVTTATVLDWAALAFIAVFGFAISYVLWFSLLKRNPVSSVTPFVMLMPVISVLASMGLLGETPGWPAFVGGALIILGVALSSGVLQRLRSVRVTSS